MDSSLPTHGTQPGPNGTDTTSFLGSSCLPYLLASQNPDGGWGFSQDLESRVEPTSWALLALRELSSVPGESAASRGYRFLEQTQLPDGSWPAAAGQTVGSWVTSLACWALGARDETSKELARGLHWLDHDEPGDAKFWWRLIRGVVAMTSKKKVNAQNEAYWGWSWTTGTASWVEPTAQALIVLRNVRHEPASRESEKRQELAERMLYDRMCPGGGWNCGNPMVYGVPGEPLVGPTVWALLALRAHPERQENRMSLNWLTENWMKIQSPGSLALAEMGLAAYGKQIPEIRAALVALYQSDFARNVPVVAWTTLALSGGMDWLEAAPRAS
jgi:hypothetical protein